MERFLVERVWEVIVRFSEKKDPLFLYPGATNMGRFVFRSQTSELISKLPESQAREHCIQSNILTMYIDPMLHKKSVARLERRG